MFVGHFAVAFAAKRAAPRASLGTLFLAAQWIDLLWPPLLLAGVEEVRVAPGLTAFTPLDFVSYPWTHSLLMVLAWAAAFGGVYAWRTGRARDAWVMAALVGSHWVLDFVTHRPDLPLAPGAAKVGLGLWNSVPGTLLVECSLFAAGVWTYARATRPTRRGGRIGLWALVATLAVFYAASAFGPPPPGVRPIAVGGLFMVLFLPWAVYVDRRREVVDAPPAHTAAPLGSSAPPRP